MFSHIFVSIAKSSNLSLMHAQVSKETYKVSKETYDTRKRGLLPTYLQLVLRHAYNTHTYTLTHSHTCVCVCVFVCVCVVCVYYTQTHRRATIATIAPSAARHLATAAPMPLLAPVTKITLPSSLPISFF
jgi:hypothetical protein